jgi:hypothetical protein
VYVNEEAAGMFWVSLIPAFLELVAWIIVASADISANPWAALACFALPILLAAIVAFLSSVQLTSAIVDQEIGSGVLSSTAMALCFIVILTSLDIAGFLDLSRLWS